MDGFIVIDKPVGFTSHDVVARVRKICNMKKVGHTGTLDPFATGVLPVALGEGTKAIPFLDESVKEYRAVMKLGQTTDSGDFTGTVVSTGDWLHLDASRIEEAFSSMTGPILQVPPMFSAVKKNGVPLYRLARRGETVEREPRPVTIYSITLDRLALPEVAFTVRCSRGTYVRTLASDMGDFLGCGAHLIALQRTASGPFFLDAALSLSELEGLVQGGRVAEVVISPHAALRHLQDVVLPDIAAARVAHGVMPDLADSETERSLALRDGERLRLSVGGRLCAVAELEAQPVAGEGKRLRLVRVFN